MTALLNYFRKKTPLQLATDELVEAQRALLEAQTGYEWAASTVAFNNARMKQVVTPEDGLTDDERTRRTATHPTNDWRVGHYAGMRMTPPRGPEPVEILSKGWV